MISIFDTNTFSETKDAGAGEVQSGSGADPARCFVLVGGGRFIIVTCLSSTINDNNKEFVCIYYIKPVTRPVRPSVCGSERTAGPPQGLLGPLQGLPLHALPVARNTGLMRHLGRKQHLAEMLQVMEGLLQVS